MADELPPLNDKCRTDVTCYWRRQYDDQLEAHVRTIRKAEEELGLARELGAKALAEMKARAMRAERRIDEKARSLEAEVLALKLRLENPPWLADAAEALGEVRASDGAPLAMNWTQVVKAIWEQRQERDEAQDGEAIALQRAEALAAQLRAAEECAAMLKTANTRMEILLGRMRACHREQSEGHEVSLDEVPDWLEEQVAALAAYEASKGGGA